MIPEDAFPAKAESWALGRTKAGDLVIAIMFVVVDCAWRGTRVQWDGFLTDKVDKNGEVSKDKVLATMRLCGWSGDPSDLSGLSTNVVHARIRHREWGGKNRPEVAWVNAMPKARVNGAIPPEQWADTIRALTAKNAEFDPTEEPFRDEDHTP